MDLGSQHRPVAALLRFHLLEGKGFGKCGDEGGEEEKKVISKYASACSIPVTPFRKELLSNPDYQARVAALEEEKRQKDAKRRKKK